MKSKFTAFAVISAIAAFLISCTKAEPEDKSGGDRTAPAAATPSWGASPVRVGILGDSISTFDGWIPEGYRTFYPYTGTKAGLTQVEQTWWHRLIYNLMPDAVLDRNLSYARTRVTKNKAPDTTKPDVDENDFVSRCTLFDDPDIIVIAGGTNDRPCVSTGLVGEYDYDSPADELDRFQFRQAYICLVRTIMEKYPDTKIVCVVNDLLLTPTYKAIGESIEAIAEHFGLPCTRIGMTLETVGDGVHPSSDGAEYWAGRVHETLRDAGLLSYRKPRASASQLMSRSLSDGEVLCCTGEETVTRTALGESLKVLWDRDDEIKVFSAECREGLTHSVSEISDDRSAAVFSAAAPVSGSPRWAVYPAAAVKSFSLDGGKATAVLDLSEAMSSALDSGLEQDTALSEKTVVSALPMAAKSEGSLFSFRNLFGAVCVRVYDYARLGLEVKGITLTSRDGKAIGGEAVIDLDSGEPVGFSGGASATRELKEPVSIDSYGWTSWSTHSNSAYSKHARQFVFFVPAGSYPQGFDVTVTDAEGLSYTFSSGPMEVGGGSVVKIERHPITVYYGSSNCITAKPGDKSVRFDVTPYCSFSERFERSGIVVGNAADAVSGASVLWQQEHGCPLADVTETSGRGTVIPSESAPALEKDGDKLFLTVPLTGAAGNAVVALKDKVGEILWSFHIWVSDFTDIECSGAEDGDFMIMDRNLGATSALDKSLCEESEIRNSFGMFYQWGRKDPFPRAVSTGTRSQSGGFALSTSVKRSDNVIGSIGYTLKNPTARQYVLTSGCNWLMTYINDLWGSGFASADVTKIASENRRVEGVKTAFDPCPEGYRVPDLCHMDALLQINSGKLAAADRDKYYGFVLDTGKSTGYFPAAGFVSSAKEGAAAVTNESYWCMYWTSSAATLNAPYLYADATGKPSWKFGVRGHLLPVRCLKMK